MDLDTMKSKLSSYPMLPAYERDINLIVENCTQYALPDQHTIPLCPIRHSTLHLFAIAHCHDRFSTCCVPCSYILFEVADKSSTTSTHAHPRALQMLHQCTCAATVFEYLLRLTQSRSHILRCSSCGWLFFSCVFIIRDFVKSCAC